MALAVSPNPHGDENFPGSQLAGTPPATELPDHCNLRFRDSQCCSIPATPKTGSDRDSCHDLRSIGSGRASHGQDTVITSDSDCNFDADFNEDGIVSNNGGISSGSHSGSVTDDDSESFTCDTHVSLGGAEAYDEIDPDSLYPDPTINLLPVRTGDNVPSDDSDCESYASDDRHALQERSFCLRISRRGRSFVVRATWDTNPIPIINLNNTNLPCLWRIHNSYTKGDGLEPEMNLFRRQYCPQTDNVDVTKTPIILTSVRKSSKVYASMIRLDRERTEFVEVGPQIVIPVNYPGWFQHIEKNNTAVYSLPTVGDVARAEYGEFIAHCPITVYRYAKRSGDGDKLYSKVEVQAGEVLATKSVLTEWLSDESIQKGCFCAGKRRHKQDTSYLKVRDTSGRRLLIPFETAGGFSEVGQRGGETRSDASYQLTDIARWLQLPIELKLVCGQLPQGLDDYTGLLRLEQLSFETSVFGCTTSLRKGQDRQLVEFPVDVNLEFVQNKNWAEVKGTDEVQSALEQCNNAMDAYVTSMKVVQDIEPDRTRLGNESLLEVNRISTLMRSLPPTPLLPSSNKNRKLRGWSWAKGLLKRYRRAQKHDTTSENSDYEVIPFYLRTVNNQADDARSAELCDALEHTNFAQFNSACDLSDIDCDSLPCTVPGSPPPPPKLIIRNRKPQNDGCHDDDGYLMPVEFRKSLSDVLRLPQSPHSAKNASASYRSIGQETCSSATLTRELNKSNETLAPPLSSMTLRTYPNSASELEYSSPTEFDKQRLDAFLSDSINELRRRKSRELLTQMGELSELKSCPTCTSPLTTEALPDVPNQHDVNNFLDKIFDCDRMSEGKVESSQSSLNNGAFPRRSVSVPEAMLPRLEHVHRGSRQCLECGYQTLDSGIWLSPRSGASDPYRQDHDSAIYRSTSDCSWVPPEHIETLTVEEVGLSLRYIGMKDYIVTRFYEEQIDGKQLTELTPDLLSEGFTELNALDKKKLFDFIKGWRPKKWGQIIAE